LYHRLEPRSWLAVPLTARGRTLGCLGLVYADSGRRYDADDLAFAAEVARRAALAVDNARLFAEVHAADRRKDEFLAVLGHELRNPLAPIRTAVALLRDPAGGNAAYAHGLIDRQVDHLTRLVDDLLDVS